MTTTKQVQDAYIVAAIRTPIGKAPRGVFKNTRPDDLLVHALRSAVDRLVAINFGRSLTDGPPDAVMASPEVRRVYLGIDVA